MSHDWPSTTLNSEDEVFKTLSDLQGRNRWLSRGHSQCYDGLVPSIDRGALKGLTRLEKLQCERRSIDQFRSAARFFASSGEQGALIDDGVALMVLRHHGVPTRLLDWSASPYVAAYFAVSDHDGLDGEIWTFNEIDYEKKGKGQWTKWPEATIDGTGDDDKFVAAVTAFRVPDPPDWIIAAFYPTGFPRQNAQHGAYTMTARFGVNHADLIRALLVDPASFHRYVISGGLKQKVRALLRNDYGIWQGSLFPDSAGAAETARAAFPK
jgi:FRG domain-containing protein